jgi:hypothetical protein
MTHVHCEWQNEIDIIYILVHTQKEKERFQRLIPHFQSRGIPLNKIQCCAPTWGSELTTDEIFRVYDPFCRQGMPILTFKARSLSRGEISLVLNFYSAAIHAIQNKHKKILVFESDTWLREDFVPRLNDLLADLKSKNDEWDYVSLGEGARTRPPGCAPSIYSQTRAYTPPHEGFFRCTDSMMFQVSFLEKVIRTLFPFRECLDWEMNVQAMFHKAKCWWADPPLAEQGTCVGRDETTLPA